GTHSSAARPAGAVVDGPAGPGDRLTPRPLPRPARQARTLTAVRTHGAPRGAVRTPPDPTYGAPAHPHRTRGLPSHAALTEEL
ncbi:hypothetical protein ACWD74_40160, partial [Streptomyces fagopyri]